MRTQERAEEHKEKRHKKAEKACMKAILQLHHDLEAFWWLKPRCIWPTIAIKLSNCACFLSISTIDMLIWSINAVSRSISCDFSFGDGAERISCGGTTWVSGSGAEADYDGAECVECKNLCLPSLLSSRSMTSWIMLSTSRAPGLVQSILRRRWMSSWATSGRPP